VALSEENVIPCFNVEVQLTLRLCIPDNDNLDHKCIAFWNWGILNKLPETIE
jgi:hypothetical protein